MPDRFGVELRAELSGDTLSGHAAVFGALAAIPADRPRYYEGLARTAFDAVLDQDVPALINHDPTLILGRSSAGTLKLSTDDSGLYFEIPQLPNTSYANDLRESVARGDVNGMSFGFIPGAVDKGRAPDGRQLRTHTRIGRLLDVSPVTYPAYDGTDVVLRSQTFTTAHDNRSRLIKIRAAALFGRNDT